LAFAVDSSWKSRRFDVAAFFFFLRFFSTFFPLFLEKRPRFGYHLSGGASNGRLRRRRLFLGTRKVTEAVVAVDVIFNVLTILALLAF